MVGPIWLRKSASSEEINRRPQNTPMMKAVGQRLIQPIFGARRSNNKTDSAKGINNKKSTDASAESLGIKLARVQSGNSPANKLGTMVSQKPITIQYAAEAPTTMASAALYNGLSPSKNEKMQSVKIAAPHKPAVREKSGAASCSNAAISRPSLTLTASCSVQRTSEPSSRVWTCSVRLVHWVPAPGWNATAFKIAIATPMSTNKTPKVALPRRVA